MGPITKYTLADENFRVYTGDDIVMIDGERLIVDSTGNVVQYPGENWQWGTIGLTDITEPTEVVYKGCIYGDAVIALLDSQSQTSYIPAPATADSPENSVNEMKFTIPAGTLFIMCSYAKNGARTQPMEIHIGTQTDITPYVSSWGDIEVIDQREGTSGVISSESYPILINQRKKRYLDISGYDLIKQLYDDKGIRARAKIIVYKRDDIDWHVYYFRKEFNIDFESYKRTPEQISVEVNSTVLKEYVNSKGSTKYDIPVAELKDSRQFNYTPVLISSRGRFTMPVGIVDQTTQNDNRVLYSIPITFDEIQTVPGHSVFELGTQNNKWFDEDDFRGSEHFLRGTSRTTATTPAEVRITAKFRVVCSYWPILVIRSATLFLYKYNLNTKTRTEVYSKNIPPKGDEDFATDVEIDTTTIISSENEVLSLVVYIYGEPLAEYVRARSAEISVFDYFRVYWQQTINEDIKLDVIKPETLLRSLLNRMNAGAFSSAIEWGNIDYTPLLCAGETLRNFENAHVHTSLKDFIEWIKCKGYEYHIQGGKITFRKRDDNFRRDVTTLQLAPSEVAELAEESNPDFAYTQIEAGYKKVDYSNYNGKAELNGTFQYSTGHVGATERKLSLISPYRADPYGIEFTIWERWNASDKDAKGDPWGDMPNDEDTKDSASDNDLFELASAEEGAYYGYYKAVYSEYKGGRIYNAILNPYFLIKENESLIGIITQEITYASTTNYRKGVVKDTRSGTEVAVDIYSNIAISKKLFEPVYYMIDVGTFKELPDERNGLVLFPYRNDLGGYDTYKGYIKQVSKNYSRNKKEEWILLAVKD
ncbi:hypothetical protein D0T49_04290 [Paludibacter sp. 221]|uniref:hypothetical protein n=1 Tax=Paludibacter sp. 221 TaxID=2302939 RepID=UPI0013D541FB|nr:hypothetical protein [Paludibacter sp. 221]NDV46259.1 hypothetical protein [Paludibacter sp. 221]